MDGAIVAGAERRHPGVAWAAAMSVAIVAACSSAPVPSAASLPARFPPLPPAIDADTAYFPDDGAVLAVVHVRQTHLPPELAQGDEPDPAGRSELADRILAANESQRAVHGVLRDLARHGWDRVFAEGEVVDSVRLGQLSVSMEYLGALRRIDAVLGAPPPTCVERFIRHGTADATGDPVWDSVRFAPGAALLLSLTKEIQLCPAERADLMAEAVRALREDGVDAAARFSDAREDAILAEVAARGNGPAVVLLGAAHDISDNVARWNRANAGRRIALVVLTPR